MSKETPYFRVRNWEKFQHYKHRNPPWIKLHFEILSSPDWAHLTDQNRVLMVACMLVASRNHGVVPHNPEYLKRVCYLNRKPDFKPLIECGFLEKVLASASAVLTNATPELETERESEKEKEPPYSPPVGDEKFEEFWTLFPRQRRGAKQKALSAWKRAVSRSPPGDILSGLLDYTKSDEVRRGFAKGAAAWLNDDRWKSDYRTFRKPTADEQIKDWVNGDERDDWGNGEIDGHAVEIPEPGFGGDSACVPLSPEGFVGQRRGNGHSGALRKLGEVISSETGGHHQDGQGVAPAAEEGDQETPGAGTDQRRRETGGA